MYKHSTEKSRSYEYGRGKEFPTKHAALSHANYKLNAMLQELGKKVSLDGNPEIEDNGLAIQVCIPVKYEV